MELFSMLLNVVLMVASLLLIVAAIVVGYYTAVLLYDEALLYIKKNHPTLVALITASIFSLVLIREEFAKRRKQQWEYYNSIHPFSITLMGRVREQSA